MALQNSAETLLKNMTMTHNLPTNNTLPGDLLTTNRTPSDNELDVARILLSHYEERICRIRDLDERSSEGKQDLVQLQYGLTVLRRVTSPFRRVPEDLIRQIFIACVNADSSHYLSMSRKRAPLLLTHICSGMRYIAIHTPELWRRFSVDIQTTWTTKSIGLESALHSKLDGVREWLHRGQDLPLCIKLTHKLYRARKHLILSNLQIAHDIINLVFSFHYRWEEINIVTDEKEPLLTLLQSLAPQDVPKLQEIALNNMLWPRHLNTHPISMPLLGSPVLRRVSGFSFSDFNAYWPQFPCSDLTNLDCLITVNDDFGTFVRILRQCHALVYLKYSMEGYSTSITGSYTTVDTIKLPQLQFLTAREYKTLISGLIAAPLLESFYQRNITGPVLSSIMRPLESAQQLSVLALDSEIHADLFIDALHCCPQLKVLLTNPRVIQYDGDKARVFEDILARFIDIDNPVCPLLEDFSAFKLVITREDIFRAFLLRKLEHFPHISRWKRVYVEITFDLPQPEISILQEFSNHPTIKLELHHPNTRFLSAGTGSNNELYVKYTSY